MEDYKKQVDDLQAAANSVRDYLSEQVVGGKISININDYIQWLRQKTDELEEKVDKEFV